MAIDHNSIPKDLRPLNVARTMGEEPRPTDTPAMGRNIIGFVPNPIQDVSSPESRPVFDAGFSGGLRYGNPTMGCVPSPIPVSSVGIAAPGFSEIPNFINRVDGNAGDQAIDMGIKDSSSIKKVKFLCSFGGKILPRPSDGMLRYVGGQTRIISVKREISFQELVQKMINTSGQPVVIKYQLPDEDLDALVSVSCPEDLENMMEEHGKLVERSSDGSAKLRVFLFSASELDPSSLTQFGELLDSGKRYLDAVNGISDDITSGITRKVSVSSMASTHNSDSSSPCQGDGGSHDITTNLTHVDPNTVLYTEVPPMPSALPAVLTGVPQTLSSPQPEIELERPLGYNLQQPLGMDFPPPGTYAQTYMDPHQEAINHLDYPHISSQIGYSNPQGLGIAGSIYGRGDHRQQLHDNTIGVPPQQFIPAVHVTMGSSASHVSIKPNEFQQFVQLHHALTNPYPEENKMGARVVRLPVDQGYTTYQPQSPVPLQGGSHGWHQVPPIEHVVYSDGWLSHQQGLCPEKTQIPEDCLMCQKALPHAHSDTLVQGNKDGITNTISDSNPAFLSLPLEDNLRAQPPNRVVVSGALGEGMVEHQGAWTQPGDVTHVDHKFGFAKDREMQHENARSLQKPNNSDHPRMVFPQGMVVFPSDVKSQYGMMSQPVGSDIPTVRIVPPKTSESPIQESSPEYFGKNPGLASKENVSDPFILSDQLRPIDGKMKGNHPSPPEVLGSNEQGRSPVNKLEMEMLMRNAFTKPRVLPDGNHISPIETLPSSSPEVLYSHYFHPVEATNQDTQSAMLGISGPYPHLKIGVQNTGYDEMWHGKPVFSDDVSNDVASGLSSGNSLNPFEGVVGDNKNLDSSNSLFSNQDPWTLQHETHFPSAVPNTLQLSKEAFVMMEEGIFHKPSVNLNKDSNLEHVHSDKEEHTKQELKAVAEGVAAMVLQSSTSVHDFNDPILEANLDKEVHDNDVEARAASKVEGVKTKLPDKTNPGLPTSESIGRLQIIKNIDLEELQELGSGTFGTVYHGKWRGSDVAIKRINDRCFAGKPSEQARMREDFWNEAIKLADLHHPNVVAFYGVVLDGPGGSMATVTEFMVNGSLRQALQRNDRGLDRHKRILIAMDVAFGMEYLHGKNIVHFDLKSDNLLVNLRDPHRPICKVGDLGLSKVKCQTLISGGVRGTLPWMAPELLNGSSNLVSEKVDVFSFGIVMWELLTGEEPYADLHYGAIIGGIVNNTLRPPVTESCDPEWRSLMERCWSSEPSERPSFTEIVNQLRSMAASLPPKGQFEQK